MPQFFIDDADINGAKAVIRGDDSHHLINVRRIREGDLLRIRTLSGKGYITRVTGIDWGEVTVGILEENNSGQVTADITLYMSLIKGGNFEFVLQKAVEVGVNRIVPVMTSRTVPDPSKKAYDKLARWTRIVSAASKQCLRSNIPEVEMPVAFSEALKRDRSAMKLIAHPEALTELRDYLSSSEKPESASIFVGPEGGFSEGELNEASDAGWMPVNFGSTHMRAETAAVILPSLLIYHWS